MDIDDLPVGGGKQSAFNENPFGAEFPNQAAQSNNSSNLSLNDKLVSKKWNERAEAYEELSEAIKYISDSKDPLFYDHSDGFKKYLSDSNPGALEKAVDLCIEYVK